MEQESVFKVVAECINRSLQKPQEINLDDRLIDDLALDSIGFIELSTDLEREYSIDISDEAIESFKTVREVVDAVLVAPTYEKECE